MADLTVNETADLKGTVTAPPSKAITHRAFIAAALSEGKSKIRRPLMCDDTLATIDACRMLGGELEQTGVEVFEVQGRFKPLTPRDVIYCRDSASTMRFLAPVCALADGISVLTGGESLRERPMGPLLDAMRQLGVQCYSTQRNGRPPLVIHGGGIQGGEASIRGDVSSQFVSGLLFAAPMAQRDTDIVVSGPLESWPYAAITVEFLREHGVEVEVQPGHSRFHVRCGQRYIPSDHTVEGDYSSAAFLLAAAAVTSSHVRVKNLRENSVQGDLAIVDLLKMMGVQIEANADSVEVKGVKNHLHPLEIDLRDNPDLVPVCTVLSCLAHGKSAIQGVRRLRFKESDRASALRVELTKLGAKVEVAKDVLKVDGGKRLRGAELDSHGDHRIAMACVLAALRAEGTSVVHGIECIGKSYPDFVGDLISLGGEVVER